MFSKLSLDVTGIMKRLREDVIAVANDSDRTVSNRLEAIRNIISNNVYLEGIQYSITHAEREIWESLGKTTKDSEQSS